MSDRFSELGLRLLRPEQMSVAQRKKIEVVRTELRATNASMHVFHEDGSCYFKGDDPVFMVVLPKGFIDGFTGIEAT